MHNKSQISRKRETKNASIVEDNQGKTNYCCKYCLEKEFKTRIKSKLNLHIVECKKKIAQLEEGVDYVICKICNFHAKKISNHVKKHNISINEYQAKYGKTICIKSSKCYANSAKGRKSWTVLANEKGEDISEKLKIRGEKISETIMKNSEERERRSKLLKELNKKITPEIRKIYSDTAKKTSARPEIIKQRTAQLKKWRDDNPEKFKEIIEKLIASIPKEITWFSKPEKMLFAYVKEIEGFQFQFNQVIKSDKFDWKSQRKQVDMGDKNNKIYLEFDGVFHFKPFSNPAKHAEVARRDELLNNYMLQNDFILIRVSYDQFIDRHANPEFKPGVLDEVKRLIVNRVKGVHKIGKSYE